MEGVVLMIDEKKIKIRREKYIYIKMSGRSRAGASSFYVKNLPY